MNKTNFTNALRSVVLILFALMGGLSSSVSAEEIILNFSQSGGLLGGISNKTNSPSNGTFNIGGYSVELANCAQQNNTVLIVAGDGKEGSITFKPSINLTAIKFNCTDIKADCKMTATIGGTSISTNAPTKNVNTINIPSGTETANKECKFTFSNKIKISTVTFVTDGTTPDTPTTTDWVKFEKYNDNSEVKNGDKLPVGQVIKLESLVQGLMTNSAYGGDYTIAYTIDGTEPTFSGKTNDAKTFWQDGNGYIYRRGIALAGKINNVALKDGDEVTVKVKIFKITYKTDGTYNDNKAVWSTSKTFTLTASTQPSPSDITFSPETRITKTSNTDKNYDYKDNDISIMDITESCTASGISGNTIIAKYSTSSTYDIQEILNAANVSLDNTTVGVFSTEYKMRKTSAVQITPDGLISSDVARAYYWYIPARKDLTLELVPSYSNLSLSKDGIQKTTVKMTAYYMENGSKIYVNLDSIAPISIISNDASIAKTDGKYILASDGLSATFTIQAVDNGTTKINVQTSKTSKFYVKKYNTGKNDKNDDETAINFNPALSDVTVKVIDGTSMAPPTITPETSEYHEDFKSSIQADANYAAYYYVVKGKQANAPTPAEIKSNGKKIIKGQKVETDIEAGDDNIFNVYAVSYDETTETLGERIAQSTYTYVKIEKPVLTPGIEGEDNYYGFDTNELVIVASVATPGAQVYYTINSANEDVTKDNGILYDGKQKIVIDRSSRIRAVAYKNGIYSEVVLYRYNKNTIDIDAPKFYRNEVIGDNVNEMDNLGSDKIVIRASYTDENDNTIDIDENSKKFHIYYTTDGSLPTPESYVYTGPFNVDGSVSKIIAYVLADGEGGDYSMSDCSTLILTNNNYHVWLTKRLAEGEEPSPVAGKGNCDKNGVLKIDHAELYLDNDYPEQKGLQVKAYFGGFASETDMRDNKQQWDHYTSKEVAKGTPIDGIGDFSVAPNIDARDEMGLLYNHSTANNPKEKDYQTHKSTFKLPSMGAYTKFEPQMDGNLTIYCFQEGALYYRDAIGTKDCFNSRFIRKRPVYFVDEAGKSIKPTGIETSGHLSKKWFELESNNFTGKDLKGDGQMQNGINQTLFTQQQSIDIYNMFNKVITAKNSSSQDIPLKDLVVYLNDGTHQDIAGYGLNNAKGDAKDNVIDGTGVCLPTASYVKYTFPVEAGKSYFFFGWMTKVGIRGFGFEPTATQPYEGDLTINTEKTSQDQTFVANKKYQSVTVNREFKKDLSGNNIWTTLVLPFSVSASEVKSIFGDDTQILHYRTIQGKTMYFFKHYHQMIVAGTPVLIKPSKDKVITNPVFYNVKIEAPTVVDKPCNDYGYQNEEENTDYNMIGSYNPQTVSQGCFYISATNGKVKQLNKQNTLGGTRAYMYGTPKESLTNMAKTSFDNMSPTSMDNETTDIDFIGIDKDEVLTDGNIYNLNGQLIRKNATNLKGLAKGIYIVNGKKVTVK